MPVVREAAGQFGPGAYVDWRATPLGGLTEAIEQRLILRLAGEVSDRSVLDVGCGDGALTLAFWRRGASRIVGCDIDPKMIARARAEAVGRSAAISYVIADGEQLPFPNESFDIVTIITVLAFVAGPAATVREIARVLKPSGQLVIGDLGRWSLWAASRRIRSWLGSESWKSARFWTAGELRQLVHAAQLRVGRVSGAVYYPRSAALAKLMAPFDPVLGELTNLGAAFLAVQASKT
jgi:ubiquinone/menaquinone biosynthesis C-methylase UbiE